jgi:PadR family transcriptional regulator
MAVAATVSSATVRVMTHAIDCATGGLTPPSLLLTTKGMEYIQERANTMAESTDVLQGTLDMLILKSLSLEAMHGFGVAKRIEQISRGVFKVNPGSLLLAFQRLERDGSVTGEWRQSENNRRAKYYSLTPRGRKHLKAETSEWERRVAAIARLLEA